MKSTWFFPLYLLLLTTLFSTAMFWGENVPTGASDSSDAKKEATELQDREVDIPTRQLIVKYKDDADVYGVNSPDGASRLDELQAATGTLVEYVREMSGKAHVYRLPIALPMSEMEKIAAHIASLSEVEFAEPDAIMLPFLTPNDPQYGDQWHYFETYGINAPAAWNITTGSSNIKVAVIDTGITNHVDLAGRWVGGYDFITTIAMANDGNGRDSDPHDPGDWVMGNECFPGSTPRDSSWHGTHIAGTIGAASNNGLGVAGINWVSQTVPVRVLGKCGGLISDIADGMRWAAGLSVSGVPANPHPAKVLNLSLGGPGVCSTTYQNAINAINLTGAIIVVAAGNNNSNLNTTTYQPANCEGVITVSATDRQGDKALYSNYGATVEISAPGGENIPVLGDGILSTHNAGMTTPAGDTYGYLQGTSMAAPHVSGVLSLMVSLDPTLNYTASLQILQNTASSFPGGSSCNLTICGSGIVNAFGALNVLPTPTPTATATATSTNTPTPTDTATKTPTPSNTPTKTATPSNTPTNTSTVTVTPSHTATKTPTPSNTPIFTNTPTSTHTPTITPRFTATITPTPSNTPTSTNTPTPSNTPTSTITHTPEPGDNFLYIPLVQLNVVPNGNNRFHAEASVTVFDGNNEPVSGATVNGAFTGDSSSSTSGLTNANGQAILSSTIVQFGADWTFCVTDVAKPGYFYNPDANLETCDSTGSGPSPTPSPTFTSTPTPESPTATSTITNTPTPTATPTFTSTPTSTSGGRSTPTPMPTFTSTPGFTPTPSFTPTATSTPYGGENSMHVSDLDGSSTPGTPGRWDATVTITVHDSDHNLVPGVTVMGEWSNGSSGTSSCVTAMNGQCSISKEGTRTNINSVTFNVTNLIHSSLTYQPLANYDPDADSNGSEITITKPQMLIKSIGKKR